MPIPVTAEAQEPASLIFAAPSQGAENAMEESGTRPVRKAQQDNTESLPPWAKELLEKSGVTDTTTQIAAFNGQQAGSSGGRQITWTAPGAGAGTQSRTADEGPAQIEYRERSGSEETPYRPQISDAEIQRTADKVYRIIEERLRRELRRSGR
jgi:hypothetical protein